MGCIMKISPADTIAAVATPPGEGALAVIRISGPQSLQIGDRIFRGRRPLSTAPGYTLHHGTIVNQAGQDVDEVLAAVFRAPRSYTGEDALEVSCHGGLFVTNGVLNAALAAGARRAEPGEFTRRAYLNGKMDLSRAEAVAALISSRSDRAHRASLEQLRGRLAGTVEEMKSGLKRLCALLEVDLDFSEEGISLIGKPEIDRKIKEAKERLERLAETFKTGRIYRDGVSVVIVGPPNAGKSSLFNALLKESRAIVTPIPGTTRDYLEETLTLGGILYRITDTAGLRKSEDPIESEGIARTFTSAETADIVLFVDDVGSDGVERDALIGSLPVTGEQQLILVRNKIDLRSRSSEKLPRIDHVQLRGGIRTEVYLSALSGAGVHALAEELVHTAAGSEVSAGETVSVISQRHAESLGKGARSLGIALESLNAGMANEFVAFDIRESVSALGEITGEITSEEILNSIFDEFCIGK
jgi:tRNA modification GTPase